MTRTNGTELTGVEREREEGKGVDEMTGYERANTNCTGTPATTSVNPSGVMERICFQKSTASDVKQESTKERRV